MSPRGSAFALMATVLARPRGFGLDSEAGGGGAGPPFRHLDAIRARKSL